MIADYVRTLGRESETLVRSLECNPLLGRIMRGDAGERDYVRFLIATYHYVRWSGFLLAKTAEGLRKSGRCAPLLTAVDRKSEEEAPHDRWVLRDLQALGVNPELVKGSPVPMAVHAYVAWSTMSAEAGSPAFLGAAYTLEFISQRRAKQAAENLRARGTVPAIEHALRFLEGHGAADEGHVAELEAVLGGIHNPLDQVEIMFSARFMANVYPHFFATNGAETCPSFA